MYLIKQQFPFMGVLRTEQVMDSYSVVRCIEQAGVDDVQNICIRFYSIQNGKDIWVSGEAVNNAGGVKDYLTDVVGLESSIVDVLTGESDAGQPAYEVVGTSGDGIELAFIGDKFNWQVFGEVTCALEVYDADVLRAAKACGVDYCQIGNKYRGHYTNFESFVQSEWEELYLYEVPVFCKEYIDYSKIATDWEKGGRYGIHEGYVFDVEA